MQDPQFSYDYKVEPPSEVDVLTCYECDGLGVTEDETPETRCPHCMGSGECTVNCHECVAGWREVNLP